MSGFVVGPGAENAGYRVRHYESIPSTNQAVMELARQGAPTDLWVVADHQSAGRGRRGRDWISQKGNLAASLLVKLPAGQKSVHMLGFVAGVALAQTAIDITGQRDGTIALKWPNDLLLGRGKLAGILLENETLSDGSLAVVAGMGMNVASAPKGLAYASAALCQLSPGVSVQMVFERLSENWLTVFSLWNYGGGNSAVLSRWRALVRGIAKPIRVELHDRIVTGTFKTIDEHGRLVIEQSSGQTQIITTGDVQF